MMKRPLLVGACVSLLLGLNACAEKPQTATPRKADQKVWQGTDNPYTVAGWKAGDKSSWEDQTRTRAQNQNEYNRTR